MTRIPMARFPSRKHAYIILTLLNPYYIVKLGWLRYTVFFLFLLKNIDCGYSLEPPRRGGSNEYPQSMFWAEIWKISDYLSENFQFLEVKFSIYLKKRVFVMRGWFEHLFLSPLNIVPITHENKYVYLWDWEIKGERNLKWYCALK